VAEVHHFCLLNSFGADAVNPYLAFATLFDASESGTLDKTNDEIVAGYIKSVNKGMLKVMAKMGVSTLNHTKVRKFLRQLVLLVKLWKLVLQAHNLALVAQTLTLYKQKLKQDTKLH
jgi:hypothetical protein